MVVILFAWQRSIESIKIVRQCIDNMPAGPYVTQDHKVSPQILLILKKMESLIHHFKLFTEDIMCQRVKPTHVEAPKA